MCFLRVLVVFSLQLYCLNSYADGTPITSWLKSIPTHGAFVQTRSLFKIDRKIEISGVYDLEDNQSFVWSVEKPVVYQLEFTKEGIYKTFKSEKILLAQQDHAALYGFMYVLKNLLSGNAAPIEALFDISDYENGYILNPNSKQLAQSEIQKILITRLPHSMDTILHIFEKNSDEVILKFTHE